MPWEEAKASSHAQLYLARSKTSSKEEQNKLANAEHRAFSREATADNPLMAVPIAAAIPLYQASKVVGATDSRSAPSIEQATEAYKGVGEGLVQAATLPWEEAKKAATEAIKGLAEGVRSILPWETAKQFKQMPSQTRLVEKPTQSFEEVFNRLIQAESRGEHTTKSGKLTTSKAGAEGITQLMRKTGKDPGFGVQPLQNKTQKEYIRFGKDYLKAMLNEFDGDYEKALAAYNAGVGNVKKAINQGGENWKDFLPKQSETLPYIDKILKGK